MEVGEVRVADDRDFRRFLGLAENTEGWLSKYNKNSIRVWVKIPQAGSLNEKSRMLKTIKFMEDVSAATCYDVLHDPQFRAEWDTTMLEGKEVYMLNHNNDISYYAVKVPSPLKNRDFVMQRTWLDTPTEYVIFNHSIYHKEFPPKKGYIRGESILTGYLIRPKGKTSCELIYVTQMDPKGTVPMWAVNKVAEYLAPSILKNLHKACQRYPAWKSVNNPHFKPWIYPEQMDLPKLKMSDILPRPEATFSSQESLLDDGELKEEDFKGDRPLTPIPPTSQIVPDNNNERTPSSKPLVNGTDHGQPEPPKRRQAPSEPPKPALRQAQSESALNHPTAPVINGVTPEEPSPSQPSPSHHQYTRNQHRSDIRVGKQQPHRPGHHASSPEISQGSEHSGQGRHHGSGHNHHGDGHSDRARASSHHSQSLGRDAQPPTVNGYGAPEPHSSPLGFMRKKLAKWTGNSRGANADDLRAMDFHQAQKEIMIREHEARMLAFQADLEIKRREHRARMVLMDQIRQGGAISGSDAQHVLLHRTSSIVMNETILGKAPDVKKDVNGYNKQRRAIEQPKADR